MTCNINYHTFVLYGSMGGIQYFIVSHFLPLVIFNDYCIHLVIYSFIILFAKPFYLSPGWSNSEQRGKESPWPVINALEENLSDEQSKSDSFLSHSLSTTQLGGNKGEQSWRGDKDKLYLRRWVSDIKIRKVN